jgi:hypothetical protein
MNSSNSINPVVETLKELLAIAEKGNLENFIFAGFDAEDRIILAKPKTNVIEDQHLVSFLQTCVTFRTMEESWINGDPYHPGMFNNDDNDDDNDE